MLDWSGWAVIYVSEPGERQGHEEKEHQSQTLSFPLSFFFPLSFPSLTS